MRRLKIWEKLGIFVLVLIIVSMLIGEISLAFDPIVAIVTGLLISLFPIIITSFTVVGT